MISCEEIVCDSLSFKVACTEQMPHELTVASFEVMRPAISPDIKGVEMIEHLELKELLPNSVHEEIIISIDLLDVAHEVQVGTMPLTIVVQVLEYENAVLNAAGIRITVSDIRKAIDGTEVHQ